MNIACIYTHLYILFTYIYLQRPSKPVCYTKPTLLHHHQNTEVGLYPPAIGGADGGRHGAVGVGKGTTTSSDTSGHRPGEAGVV